LESDATLCSEVIERERGAAEFSIEIEVLTRGDLHQGGAIGVERLQRVEGVSNVLPGENATKRSLGQYACNFVITVFIV
jgi:hypothetical protein